MDKRDRASTFRSRLTQAMEQADTNQSALARAARVDRSTISQILAPGGTRMPNAQVVAECAAALGISADWLLGLTDRPESAAELMAESLLMTKAPRAFVDESIIAWHREAEGFKVRHVPATLPDMLKTQAMLEWEYAPQLGRSSAQAIRSSQEHLQTMRSGRSDYEMAIPTFELNAFACGEGYYAGLPRSIRRDQLAQIEEIYDQLFPSLRIFAFDARRVFSSPVTIFGPLLAAIYLGRNYVVFRDVERVRGITGHFDWLVREADVSDRDFPNFIRRLRVENELD
jgi:transcriptional regulator with XRE-family HTH domain